MSTLISVPIPATGGHAKFASSHDFSEEETQEWIDHLKFVIDDVTPFVLAQAGAHADESVLAVMFDDALEALTADGVCRPPCLHRRRAETAAKIWLARYMADKESGAPRGDSCAAGREVERLVELEIASGATREQLLAVVTQCYLEHF